MKIYTRRGDRGQTDLFGGVRVSKANPRVMAYGAVDAANSAIGFVAACTELPREIAAALPDLMSDMFDLGAELAMAKIDTHITGDRVSQLEKYIDDADTQLPPIKAFILPTGCEAAARFHLARTAVRFAEQQVVQLVDGGETIRDDVLIYLNRLSDLMFTWARLCEHEKGLPDVLWKARKIRL